MAQPRHPEVQRQSVKPDVVEEKVPAPTEEKVKTPEISEEMQAVGLFEAMLKKIGEMYTTALGLQNTPELAEVLAQISITRVKIESVVEKLRMEEQMRVAAQALQSRDEEVEHGNS